MRLGRAGDVRRLAMMAAGLIIVYTARRWHINENVMFLSIIAALHGVASVAVRRSLVWVSLFAVTVLAYKPMTIQAPILIDLPVDNYNLFTAHMHQGQSWHYTFTLTDLDQNRSRCGELRPRLYVVGESLTPDTIDVQLVGTSPVQPPEYLASNGLKEIHIIPRLDAVSEFSVVLTPKPGSTPEIRVGSEVHNGVIYTDSVYLVLENSQCRILYQTMRKELPAVAK